MAIPSLCYGMNRWKKSIILLKNNPNWINQVLTRPIPSISSLWMAACTLSRSNLFFLMYGWFESLCLMTCIEMC